jgi:hypothetical protein
VEHLALQVAQFDLIGVDDAEVSDAGGGEVSPPAPTSSTRAAFRRR